MGGVPTNLHQRDGCFLVLARADIAVREDAVRGDPVARLLVDFRRVGLEYHSLARTPAPRIHLGVEALREFLLVVVRVELRPQVDVALRAAQRGEELA